MTGSAERRRPPALPLVALASETASNTQETFIPCVPCNARRSWAKDNGYDSSYKHFFNFCPSNDLGNNNKGNLPLRIDSTNI